VSEFVPRICDFQDSYIWIGYQLPCLTLTSQTSWTLRIRVFKCVMTYSMTYLFLIYYSLRTPQCSHNNL
jgi:hypothetical protein